MQKKLQYKDYYKTYYKHQKTRNLDYVMPPVGQPISREQESAMQTLIVHDFPPFGELLASSVAPTRAWGALPVGCTLMLPVAMCPG